MYGLDTTIVKERDAKCCICNKSIKKGVRVCFDLTWVVEDASDVYGKTWTVGHRYYCSEFCKVAKPLRSLEE